MDRNTILKPMSCDLKRLPLQAIEAFILSQLDGQLTLEEIAQIAGLDLVEASRLGRHLIELGAAATVEAAGPMSSRKKPAVVEEVTRPARSDPRAEHASIRVAPPKPEPKPEPQPQRRASRKSMRMQRATPPKGAPVDEKCELDEETQANLVMFDARTTKLDYYAILEVDRDADKKAIKRAYFALASKFHPDRFFGKKLGPARASVDRIFHRLTEAHDTLANASARATYDASLPRTPAPTRRKSSKAMRAPSRRMQAPRRPTQGDIKKPKTVAPPVAETKKPKSVPPPPAEAKKPKSVPPPFAEITQPPRSARDILLAAKELKVQARVELCVQAAEEAMRNDDVIGAANNYRLALEHREDSFIRAKLEEVDERSKTVRFTRSVTQGRMAERDQRWSDAAMHLARANDTRPTAEIADRAAQAMRMINEIDRAVTLAEQAVKLEPKNAGYRMTLAEVYLAANRLPLAEEECEMATAMAPRGDARGKALESAIAKKKKRE